MLAGLGVGRFLWLYVLEWFYCICFVCLVFIKKGYSSAKKFQDLLQYNITIILLCG